jgi:hypothetical protein
MMLLFAQHGAMWCCQQRQFCGPGLNKGHVCLVPDGTAKHTCHHLLEQLLKVCWFSHSKGFGAKHCQASGSLLADLPAACSKRH